MVETSHYTVSDCLSLCACNLNPIYAAIGMPALVKGGKYIEAMARVKAIALDKTRTITYGSPNVSDVFPLNGTSRQELLACTRN
jgi:Cd2+/Zn2+-exporting ATPase